MSDSEKVIFDSMLPNRQLWYLSAGKKASDKAAELFPANILHNDLRNGKQDAYRHALWNGICTLLIGQNLTEQLTTSHEEKPFIHPFDALEKQMDLYNNNQGRLTASYSNISNIYTNILTIHQNGLLEYISNLDANSLPTLYSTLIPTNQ